MISSFAHPALLFLQLIPVLILVWVWTSTTGHVALPLDGARRPGQWIAPLIKLADSLPALILSASLFILAGPQQTGEPRTRKSLTNIEFCVDISGSMTAPFGSGSRYDASMQAINDFLDDREGDAFGLTFFGNSVLHWVPLTSDASAIRCSPPFMRPESAPRWFGGTEIGKAVLACRERLVGRELGDRMIILVSDGSSSDLFGGRDQEIARLLGRDGITLYAIHIADTTVPDQIVNMTSLSGGEVFSPGDTQSLESVFRRIDEMQETQLEKISAERLDYFLPFTMAGLVLLGLASVVWFGVRYTPW